MDDQGDDPNPETPRQIETLTGGRHAADLVRPLVDGR